MNTMILAHTLLITLILLILIYLIWKDLNNQSVRIKLKRNKMAEKKWFESKTVWINVLALVGGVITMLAGELQAGGAITTIGIVNVILRYVTTSAITLK